MNTIAPRRHTTRGHQHAEAFCWMRYATAPGLKYISLRIWNSRDGVTPFMMQCKEYGAELTHIDFQDDKYEPDYKPVKGDLIWTSYTEEEAEQAGQEWYGNLITARSELAGKKAEEILEKYGYDVRSQFDELIVAGMEAAMKDAVQRLYEEKQPKLKLVQKDWE